MILSQWPMAVNFYVKTIVCPMKEEMLLLVSFWKYKTWKKSTCSCMRYLRKLHACRSTSTLMFYSVHRFLFVTLIIRCKRMFSSEQFAKAFIIFCVLYIKQVLSRKLEAVMPFKNLNVTRLIKWKSAELVCLARKK